MKNSDITETEINKITEKSPIRERALFTIIRQSGLTPKTIIKLKIKQLEKITDPDTPIPCKIEIIQETNKTRFGRHPSFIGEEAVKYIKNYLTKRKLIDKEKLTLESLLFITHNKPAKQITTRELNRTFKKIAHKVRNGNPPELNLNDLSEFFKQKADKIGLNHLNYLMGNISKNNYTPKDDEFYRKLYKDIIMDFLEIEPLSKSNLRARDIQISNIASQLDKIRNVIFPTQESEQESFELYLKEHPEEEIVKHIEKVDDEHRKWILKNPDWEKEQKAQSDSLKEEIEKWENEHPELVEESRKGDILFNEFLESRYTEEEKRYNELEKKYNNLLVKIDEIEDVLKKYKKAKK